MSTSQDWTEAQCITIEIPTDITWAPNADGVMEIIVQCLDLTKLKKDYQFVHVVSGASPYLSILTLNKKSHDTMLQDKNITAREISYKLYAN